MIAINEQKPTTSTLGGGGTVRKIWRPRDPQGKYVRGTRVSLGWARSRNVEDGQEGKW